MKNETKSTKPQLTVRVAPETLDHIERLSEKLHLGKTAIVQLALNEYLARELAKLPPKKD